MKMAIKEDWRDRLIQEASIELENRRVILSNLAPDTHQDIILAAELEVIAQEKRLNGIIVETKTGRGGMISGGQGNSCVGCASR